MGQLKSLKRRLQKEHRLKKRFQQTFGTDVKACYVRKVEQDELNEAREKLQSYLPPHLVIKPHKPEKVRKVCNAAVKYQRVALNDKLLSAPGLLRSPIGVFFTSESDIELMFHQVAVRSNDSRCFKFLWREDSEQKIEVYGYTRHFSWGEELANSCKLRFASTDER